MTPAAREHRFSRIQQIGCLACRMRGWDSFPEVHHLNLGGHAGQLRRGDEETIGLCKYHHRGEPIRGMTQAQCTRLLGPSLALNSRDFREAFGTDDELLKRQNRLIAEWDAVAKGIRRA